MRIILTIRDLYCADFIPSQRWALNGNSSYIYLSIELDSELNITVLLFYSPSF